MTTHSDANTDAAVASLDAATIVAHFWRAQGLTAATVELFGLSVAARDGRVWLRCPVHDVDGRVRAIKLFAADGTGGTWEGMARSDLAYGVRFTLPGVPVLVVSAVRHVWRLAAAGLPAVCVLCGPDDPVPATAIEQIVAAGPSLALVIDDEDARLPGGAGSVVRALRAAGLDAGGYRLPVDPLARALGWGGATLTDLATRVGLDGAVTADPDLLYAAVAGFEPVMVRASEEGGY